MIVFREETTNYAKWQSEKNLATKWGENKHKDRKRTESQCERSLGEPAEATKLWSLEGDFFLEFLGRSRDVSLHTSQRKEFLLLHWAFKQPETLLFPQHWLNASVFKGSSHIEVPKSGIKSYIYKEKSKICRKIQWQISWQE